MLIPRRNYRQIVGRKRRIGSLPSRATALLLDETREHPDVEPWLLNPREDAERQPHRRHGFRYAAVPAPAGAPALPCARKARFFPPIALTVRHRARRRLPRRPGPTASARRRTIGLV